MKKIYLIIAFVLLAFSGYAQKGIISGKVLDIDDKMPLPGAMVQIVGENKYSVSDYTGRFELLNINPGTYQVQVKYIGYTAVTHEITVAEGKNNVLDFSLKTSGTELNEVVVGDILKGQAKALNQQKNNKNIGNVISSDQVGRFPDANVGDALKRVPGITMQNDQGEARNIIIRGLAPSLNSVTLNGDRIPSAEGDNRNVQMDLIPSDMISTIEVNKTLTSDMDADAIGGSVNLVTRATPNGERISATLAGGYLPIRENASYTAGLVYGNRFFDNKLGAVFSGSYNNVDYGSDNIENEWVKDEFGNEFLQASEIRKYEVQRIRRSGSIALDYKFNENNSIFANAIYNWRDDRENRFRTTYDDIEAIYDGENITGFEGRVKRQTKGGIDNNRNKGRRLEDQRVQNYSIRGEHLINSKLDLDWSANYAKAREYRPGERYTEYRQKGLEMTQDLSDIRFPLITTTGEAADQFELNSITENTDETSESEFGAKVNIRIPFTVIPSQKGRIRTGLRLRLKEKERNNNFFSYSPINDGMELLSGVPTSFFDGKNFNPGNKYVPGTFVSSSYLGNLDLNNAALFEKEADAAEYLAVNYNAKESIYAAYVRWDQDFTDKLSMVLGFRVENTQIDYTGNRVLDEEELESTINNKNSYTNLLPSVSFQYNATKDLVLRAAATTALARPNYYALAPYVNNISADKEITAGNPALDVTYAYNYDFMAENYFKSVGLISGGVFYKTLNDFIYNYSDNQYTDAKFAADFPNQSNPIPAGENWSFLQSRNGDQVNVYGFEVAIQRQLDFLPGKFLKGFGIYLNYTHTKSKAKGIADEDGNERKNISLPGTAPHMFNGSLSWENKRFSARISTNFTSDYLDELGSESYKDSFYDKQFFLDANASYKITSHLRVFAEANNLTNQPLRYYQGVAAHTKQAEYYQARYNFGLKFDL
ncbi:TonB-dependent receptor [Flavobacterium hercynium]|uniref:TonB-dependent receptor n=1 Tax=Flavobacterium hercynium TaxID=387094 RepID=A0A226HEP3_9FLAO|nr:TonB-dependent receptor [Flavobacterium hercynium]OXA92819.1 TonB-dependent receptor [Flavobacterium hercynium]SMP02403.1 TonB-dependent receptor [Flavobacterium hercynium]